MNSKSELNLLFLSLTFIYTFYKTLSRLSRRHIQIPSLLA